MKQRWLYYDSYGGKPPHQVPINSADELGSAIDRAFRQGGGTFGLSQVELGKGIKGDFLLCGVEGEACFANFNPWNSGKKPSRAFLWAVNSEIPQEGVRSFNVGNTATHIPNHRCISKAMLKEIAQAYFAKGTLSESVKWEED